MDATPGNGEIYFKRSTDGGTTWSANRRLTNNAGHSEHPDIAVDGLNIYVVWNDATPGNGEIYFKRSTDGGTTWSANRRLTNNAGESRRPQISVNGSNIYMVWREETTGNREIYFKRSTDGGITWSANRRLTNNAGESQDPQISVNGSNIYVVWDDDSTGYREIYFKRSTDGGITWSANMRLTNNTNSWSPVIAVDGPNIYVVWGNDTPGNGEIYFKRSADRGATWTANRRLTNNTGGSWDPFIAVDGSNIYVVWMDDTPGNYEIYFKKGILE
jgi:Tol biopolymer transport system component